jgi:hypothetical protein
MMEIISSISSAAGKAVLPPPLLAHREREKTTAKKI